MGTKAPDKHRDTARVPASGILISFFLSGGVQLTAHNRHWN
jgi:hypothetical protein